MCESESERRVGRGQGRGIRQKRDPRPEWEQLVITITIRSPELSWQSSGILGVSLVGKAVFEPFQVL